MATSRTSELEDEAVVIDIGEISRDRSSDPPSGRRGSIELWIRVDPSAPDIAEVRAAPGPTPPEGARRAFALQIERDEPLALGLQRICLAQFDVAIGALRDRRDLDTCVHRARKAMKRIRGVLRLVRDVIGPEAYFAENSLLRDSARRLSDLRSSAVLVETAAAIAPASLDPDHAAELVATIEDLHRNRSQPYLHNGQLWLDMITTLSAARTRFVAWPVHAGVATIEESPIRIVDDFSSLASGLLRVYRRGRRGLQASSRGGRSDDLHEYRKRVKYLRYEMEVLHQLWPEVIGGLATSLADLADVLGDERDMAQLAGLVSAEPALLPDDDARHALILDVERRRYWLRRRSYELGDLVYAEGPRRFVNRLESYWVAARPAPI